MKRRVKRKMGLILGVIFLLVSTLVIYFNVPYSRLKTNLKDYLVESEENISENKKNTKYTLENLPQSIQNFYSYTKLVNKVNSNHVSFDFKDADFLNIEMNKKLKIDYSEHIFGDIPARFAFIDSSLYGIPFQGLDSFINGEGGMKGVVAKNITLFNQRGEDMNRAALVTWLAEIIFMPSQLLSGDVDIKEIDKNTVDVSITYDNISASGIYKFLDSGELVEFTTDDRALIYNDGRLEHRKWSALYEDYKNIDDLLLPNRLKSKWHFDNEDIIYFDGTDIEYTFY
ncbi:hypothetical protein GCM10008908_00600 [Clostridium subterminale]|uniref:Uncharacterized protein n=1 Tax=Clostridium subterminale TaxID=1550 RepID=A0ABN1KF52_CLOSU